jgi:uncharacterized RDD family membrane protein YckC
VSRIEDTEMMQLYINRDGERTGPHALEEVNRQLAAGRFSPSDLAWSETSPGWKPLLSFAGVMMPGAASSSAMPLGMATPVIFESRNYAGFWIRAVAGIIDVIILAVLAALIVFLLDYADGNMSILRVFIPTLVCFLYFPTMWSSPMQATLGQRICSLRVTTADAGDPISFSRGLLRVLGMILSGAIFGIGYLMIAFTERKRGLHDMIAGTCVVKSDW